ncbi:phosphatidate cytidylyltransferase [Candidatus Bathyarchaeota archaeon]|nr:phosphatidate cytidylyltransferase [Candidatus Bathyarchaeota archaeon]
MSIFFGLNLLPNLILVGLTYVYILSMIFVSDKVQKIFKWSAKTSRKTLHLSIGILPLILPFFNHRVFPLIVALTFIPITFLASPYSPFKGLKSKLSMLQDKTEIGHPLGLVFYSVSYTILTTLFFQMPYIVAAGVIPMAYGDSTAALVGERYGKRKYKIFTWKSIEGSVAIFCFTFLGMMLGLAYYSIFFSFSFIEIVISSLLVALIATIIEALSPKGADNIFVPLACAACMYLLQMG